MSSQLRAGKTARVVYDTQGDLPKSLMGRKVTIMGRERSADVDGQKAFLARPENRKHGRLFWEDELG